MWRPDAQARFPPVVGSLIILVCRSLFIVVDAFQRERIRLQAASLTYVSLLSLVPILAIAFSLFTAFGGLERTGEELKLWVVQALAVQQQDIVTEYLDRFIQGANAGGLGAVGSVFLFVTALQTLTSIEKAFNDIWGVNEARSWIRRVQVYLPLVTIGPVLFGVALSSIVAVESSDAISQWVARTPGVRTMIGLGPVLLYTVLLFGLYSFIPNTRVKVGPALVGGFVAASCWVITQRILTENTGRMISYSAIYGSFSVVPITILWIYISWTLVLLGATVSFAVQSSESFEPDRPVSVREREQAATRLMMVIAKWFAEGLGARSAQKIVAAAHVPPRMGRRILEELAEQQLLVKVMLAGEETGYAPARSLEDITLSHVISALRGRPDTNPINEYYQLNSLQLLETAQKEEERCLQEKSLRDLLAD